MICSVSGKSLNVLLYTRGIYRKTIARKKNFVMFAEIVMSHDTPVDGAAILCKPKLK